MKSLVLRQAAVTVVCGLLLGGCLLTIEQATYRTVNPRDGSAVRDATADASVRVGDDGVMVRPDGGMDAATPMDAPPTRDVVSPPDVTRPDGTDVRDAR